MNDEAAIPAAPGREIVCLAQGWIGTPYHHQASVKGIGCDCLGLVRGIWREVYGREPEAPPAYSRDWGEADGRETLIEAAARHLRCVTDGEPQPGDVVIFRLRDGSVAKHAAIVSGPRTMIHAMEGGPVREVPLGRWWRRRIAAVYRFPRS